MHLLNDGAASRTDPFDRSRNHVSNEPDMCHMDRGWNRFGSNGRNNNAEFTT